MGAFFIMLSVVLWGMQAVVGGWLFFNFPKIGWKMPVLLLPFLLTLLLCFSIQYTRAHYGWWESVLYYFSYTWFGLVYLAFSVSAVLTVIQWGMGLFHFSSRPWMGWLGCAVIVILWILAFWGGFSEPKIKHIQVQIPQVPQMKIAILSDSHLGMGVSKERFSRALDRLEAEKPDVLFVLGDVFEYGKEPFSYAERLAQTVEKLPLGAYGVFGNHEYYVGYDFSRSFYEKAKIRLLENEMVLLENGLQVAGVTDVRTTRVPAEDVTKLLEQADQRPLALLSHTPLFAEEASSAGADLMFSGHTHNGQLFPFGFFVRLQFLRVYGLYEVGKMKFYITSGMFYWGIPLRLFAPAEIPVIEVNP